MSGGGGGGTAELGGEIRDGGLCSGWKALRDMFPFSLFYSWPACRLSSLLWMLVSRLNMSGHLTEAPKGLSASRT